ncbi:MAG TPA: hypothetical protein VEI82_11880, partial [Myxococcota bacterium]|nr:hypothetical protein [Myxococcota bacterium]
PPAPEAQAPGAGETAPPSAGAQPESAGAQPEAAPAQPEAAPAQPEAAAPAPPEPPRAAPAPAPTPPLVAPEPEAPAGFPWSLAFGTVAFIAALVISYLYLRERMDRPAPAPRLPRSPAGALTPSGVEGISPADLRGAADATSVLEQRLDEEVRARVALEERLAEAGEELKVLRDRVHRVERRREEAH